MLFLSSLMLFSCGSLEFSRHRYTKGFHLSLSGNNPDQNAAPVKRQKSKRRDVSAVNDFRAVSQISLKKDSIPEVYSDTIVTETAQGKLTKGRKITKPVSALTKIEKKSESITPENSHQANFQQKKQASRKDTDFTGTHVVVGILSLMLLIGFLAAHGWVEAIFFVILVLIAILAAALELDDCCLW